MTPLVPFPSGTVLWVAAGGALGAAVRFGLGEVLRGSPYADRFPWATLVINVTGALVLGWFMRWTSGIEVTPQVRAFVAIGVCGGYTTFSTFALENLALLQGGQVAKALLHAVLSVVLSVGAAWLGWTLGKP